MNNQDCKDKQKKKQSSEAVSTPTRGETQTVPYCLPTPELSPSSVEDTGDSLSNATIEPVLAAKEDKTSVVKAVESQHEGSTVSGNKIIQDKNVAGTTDLKDHTPRKPKTNKENKVNKTKLNDTLAISPSVPKPKVRRGAQKSNGTETQTGSSKGRQKKKTAEPVQTNTIKNYFPIRRSERQTKSEIEKAKQHQLEQQIKDKCEDGLEKKIFENKGRGIVATKVFRKGDFVVEYAGELIDLETAKKREEKYALKTPVVGCYMYYFSLAGKQYCVDATTETKFLGRLVNHSREGNCCTKAVMVDEKPHLILIASRDIQPGEELCYDYGDRRRAAIEEHPWLKL